MKALALALLGVLLLRTAPLHRLDLLAYGVAAAVAGLAWRPALGPALIGASLPVYFFSRDFGPLAFSPPGMLLLLAWAGLLARLAYDRVRRQPTRLAWPTTGYDAPLALFLASALLSLLVTEYPRLSLRELRALVLEPALFFWLLAALRGYDAPAWALRGFLAACVGLALAAVAQVALGLGGTEAEGVRRAQAWYPSANHLGLTLGRALPFLAALALHVLAEPTLVGGGRALARAAQRVAACLAAALVALALGLTFSLGAWLGTAAAATALAAGRGQRRLALALVGSTLGTLLVLAVLAGAGVLPDRISPFRATSGLRVELWRASLEMVRDYPLLGIGLDNFGYLYHHVYLRPGAVSEPNLSHPHNWVLHLWLQMGLPGLVAFVWLVWRARAALRERLGSPSASWLALGAAGALADTLVHGLLDNSLFLVDLAFVFWLVLAVAIAARPLPVARIPAQ